jgi:hypothetical protein
MPRFTTTARTRLASVVVSLAAAGGFLLTGVGTADAAVTSTASLDAHCYSAYGQPGLVGLLIHDNYASPYQRAVQVQFRNNGDPTWRVASGWFYIQPGQGIMVQAGQWKNPGTRADWHQYQVVTYALTASGWQYQGSRLAYATNALTQGGTETLSPYPGWCIA